MARNTVELDWKTGFGPASAIAKLRTFQSALKREMEAAMKDAVLRIEATAKRNAPVDTGRLRASITHEVEKRNPGLAGRIGSNVQYAPVQEVQQPYLRPAIESEIDWIIRRFERAEKTARVAL